jgi:sugar/nucleoside kinase (ribokinase family)
VLVVGSVAFDDVETPFGQVKDALGGSASYFSLAASLYSQVNLVGVVGTDFHRAHVDLLREKGVDVRGLQVADGRTFRWAGRYDDDLNTAHTLDTQLNVFAEFRPQLPDDYRQCEFVFLANIDPDLQIDVLRQVPNARLRVLDTMNFWIAGKREKLVEALGMVDVALLNEAEARQLANTYSLITAAKRIRELGPKVLVIKKGEYGAVVFSEHGYFVAPAYPLENVKDPTGAGDSFAGGFVGYLAKVGEVTPSALRRAVVLGSVVASYTVEDFSVRRLTRLNCAEITARYREFKHFTSFEDID